MAERRQKDELIGQIRELCAKLGEEPQFGMNASTLPTLLKYKQHLQGRGIRLVHNVSRMHFEDCVVQQYMPNPMLVDGCKFDLRVYVLVSSCDPLKVFMARNGLVRLATEKYKAPDASNMHCPYIHLTNYSINKRNDKFVMNDNPEDLNTGNKRDFRFLNKHLATFGVDVADFWEKVRDLILKTLLSVQPTLKHVYRTCLPHPSNLGNSCFEVLGFDIILDDKARPFLLEVNQAPSFSTDSPMDYIVKRGVILETMALICVEGASHALTSAAAHPAPSSQSAGLGLSIGNVTQAPQHYLKRREAYENAVMNLFQRIYPLPADCEALNRKYRAIAHHAQTLNMVADVTIPFTLSPLLSAASITLHCHRPDGEGRRQPRPARPSALLGSRDPPRSPPRGGRAHPDPDAEPAATRKASSPSPSGDRPHVGDLVCVAHTGPASPPPPPPCGDAGAKPHSNGARPGPGPGNAPAEHRRGSQSVADRRPVEGRLTKRHSAPSAPKGLRGQPMAMVGRAPKKGLPATCAGPDPGAGPERRGQRTQSEDSGARGRTDAAEAPQPLAIHGQQQQRRARCGSKSRQESAGMSSEAESLDMPKEGGDDEQNSGAGGLECVSEEQGEGRQVAVQPQKWAQNGSKGGSFYVQGFSAHKLERNATLRPPLSPKQQHRVDQHHHDYHHRPQEQQYQQQQQEQPKQQQHPHDKQQQREQQPQQHQQQQVQAPVQDEDERRESQNSASPRDALKTALNVLHDVMDTNSTQRISQLQSTQPTPDLSDPKPTPKTSYLALADQRGYWAPATVNVTVPRVHRQSSASCPTTPEDKAHQCSAAVGTGTDVTVSDVQLDDWPEIGVWGVESPVSAERRSKFKQLKGLPKPAVE